MADHAEQLKGLTIAMVPASAMANCALEAFQQTVKQLEESGASVQLLDPPAALQGRGPASISPNAKLPEKAVDNRLSDFTGQLLTGMVDAVIFRTGAGVDHFLEVVSRQQDAQRVADLLSDSQVIAASPQAAAALAAASIKPISAFSSDAAAN